MSIATQYHAKPGDTIDLADWATDDTNGLKRKQIEAKTEENTLAIAELQHKLYAEDKRSLLIVLQSMDAGGKDSTIRHVFGRVNPQGVHVMPFKRPTEKELSHDFLWRVHHHTPGRGCIGIFNRSHYEDVLVARVNNLVPESIWAKRYELINSFEQGLVNHGTQIVKIYLHLSKDRQKEKLADRLINPEKNWKFEPGDLKTREHWDEFMHAYSVAISRCNTDDAPWYIVPTDRKWHRVHVVSEIVRAALEDMNPQYPEPKIDPTSARNLLDQIQ